MSMIQSLAMTQHFYKLPMEKKSLRRKKFTTWLTPRVTASTTLLRGSSVVSMLSSCSYRRRNIPLQYKKNSLLSKVICTYFSKNISLSFCIYLLILVSFVSVLAVVVFEGLALPHKGHRHMKNDLLSDRRSAHGSKHQHKPCARHHPPAHVVATGAQRETVPTPLQDFVLLSGSPLFHERPRVSDIKSNTTDATAAAATDQKAPQGPQEKEAAVSPTMTKLQGPQPALSTQPGEAIQQHQELVGTIDQLKTEQKQVNGTEQHAITESKESSKTPPALSQELPQKTKEGLNQGKDQEKLTNGTNSKGPGVAITETTPSRPTSSSGETVSPENSSLANGEQGNPTGNNASSKIVAIAVNGQNVGTNYKTTSPKENQTDTSVASNIKPESESQNIGAGHFPFNIPGVRNYGNGKNDSKMAEASKLITDKETKLGLHENLGPNCHWKTTKGANGAVITSVACSGEFHKPEAGNKGGLEEVGQKPEQGERLRNKESSDKLLTSPMKTQGGEIEMQLQSKRMIRVFGKHWLRNDRRKSSQTHQISQ